MKAIARHLGVSVGSVSLWTRDIELTEEQVAAIVAYNHRSTAQARGGRKRSEIARAKRLNAQTAGRQMARERKPLHQAGCMLFWAEGSKRRNSVQLVNSDPNMLRYFMGFLAQCYGVTPDRYCFSVNCYLNNGLTLADIEEHWLRLLGLPRTSVRKAMVNNPPRVSKQLKRNLPYGTAHVIVHSTYIVQSIYGAIQEYAGFEEPAWLG